MLAASQSIYIMCVCSLSRHNNINNKMVLPISGGVYTGSEQLQCVFITILAKKAQVPLYEIAIGHVLFPIFYNTGILD